MVGHRKADAFAALLDGHPQASSDPSLARLAGLADRLQSLPLKPVAGSAALRSSVLAGAPAAHAAGQAAASTPAAGSAAHALASGLATTAGKAAMGALAVAVAGTGVGVATSRSLPGDPFYGLKRAVESLQIDIAGGGRSGAHERAAVASTRLAELSSLVHSHASADVLTSEVSAWTSDVTAAVAELAGVSATERRGVLTDLAGQAHELALLLPDLPAQADAVIRQALRSNPAVSALLPAAAAGLLQAVAGGLPGPGGSPPATVPGTSPSPAASPSTGQPSSPQPASTPTQPGASPAPSPSAPGPTGTPTPRPSPTLPLPSLPLPSVPVPTPSLPLDPSSILPTLP